MKRDEFGFVLPNLYYQFLTEWKEIDPYEIGDTGICLYAKEDLKERNCQNQDHRRNEEGMLP